MTEDKNSLKKMAERIKKEKVTICASATFIKDAEKWKERLEVKGYDVIQIPVPVELNYGEIHKLHYKSITKSDVNFVLNLKKNGVENYIGPSVFAEIAFTIGLNVSLGKSIRVVCLNPIPEGLSYSEELLL